MNGPHTRLRRAGSWFAFAVAGLLALAVAYEVVIALAGGFDYITTMAPAPPEWVNRAQDGAGLILGLFAVTAVAGLALAAIDTRAGARGLILIAASHGGCGDLRPSGWFG